MRLLFNTKNQEFVEVKLFKNKHLLGKANLTITHDFDILLIKSIDKLLHKYKMDKLSLKSVETSGEMRSGAMSGMILKTVAKALTI